MKKFTLYSWVYAFILLTLATGCGVEYPTGPNGNFDKYQLLFKIDGVQATEANILVQTWTRIEAFSPSGAPLNNVVWSFSDGHPNLNGNPVERKFAAPDTLVVSVTARDSANNVHQGQLTVRIVTDLNQLNDFVVIQDGQPQKIIAIKKELFDGGNFYYTGDVTNWSPILIPPADVNWLVSGNQLVAPEGGQPGTHVVIRQEIGPGNYEGGAFRVDIHGNERWFHYRGPYAKPGQPTIYKFTVGTDNRIRPYQSAPPVGMPGSGNDTLVRSTVTSSAITLFIRVAGTSPFVKFQDSSGVYLSPQALITVTGYPEWRQVTVQKSAMPIKDMMIFSFGTNIQAPLAYDVALMEKSRYWDPLRRVLKIQFLGII